MSQCINSHGTHVTDTIAVQDMGVFGLSSNIGSLIWFKQKRTNIIDMSLAEAKHSKIENIIKNQLEKSNTSGIANSNIAGNDVISCAVGYDPVISITVINPNIAHPSFSQTNSDVEWFASEVEIFYSVIVTETKTIRINGIQTKKKSTTNENIVIRKKRNEFSFSINKEKIKKENQFIIYKKLLELTKRNIKQIQMDKITMIHKERNKKKIWIKFKK